MTNDLVQLSGFAQEIADIICERIADGASLRKICEEDDTLPSMRTIMRWLAKDEHEEFRRLYAQAQNERADVYFDETIELSDNCSQDHHGVAKARLQVDTRKWVCARMNPKKYSDRINIDANLNVSSHEQRLAELE